jgi:hypothetical protein
MASARREQLRFDDPRSRTMRRQAPSVDVALVDRIALVFVGDVVLWLARAPWGPALPRLSSIGFVVGAWRRGRLATCRPRHWTNFGNERGSARAGKAWSCPSTTTDTASDTETSAAVALRTLISGWIAAPATNVVPGKRSSRDTPGRGSPAANVGYSAPFVASDDRSGTSRISHALTQPRR